MTASDHLKQRTGSLGGDRLQRFDARLVNDSCGNPDVLMKEMHDGLFVRYEDAEAALAQKTRECEELQERFNVHDAALAACYQKRQELEAQVEQLGRQVAEKNKEIALWKADFQALRSKIRN